MTTTFGKYLVLSLLVTLSLPAGAETASTGAAPPSPRVTVRVYDYAQVSPDTLARAEKLAAEIFRKAGVQTVWLDCRVTAGQPAAACEQPRRRTDLILRIIFRSLIARDTFGETVVGYALRREDGSGGDLATVFYDRVQQEVVSGGFDEFVILGHAAAHEIGHLLLPTPGHSPTGLMRAHLMPKDWRRAADRELLFTPQEAEQLQAEALARSRQQETAQLPTLASGD